ncbi:MAG: M20/M25/M40 family metallo-hydrolase [Planctomycetota bacterium]
MKHLLCSSLLLAGAALALAGERSAQVTESELTDHVRYLASDQLEGRDTGSKGERAAGEYISRELASYGLKPAGEDGTWFQTFQVAGGASLGDGARLSIAAGGWERDLALRGDWLPFGFSTSAKDLDVPLVFVGFGVTNAEAGYDDYAGVDVKGKAVLMLRREPNAGGRQTSRHAYFTTKAQNARAHGAVAMLVVNDEGHPEGGGILPFTSMEPEGLAAAHLRREPLEKLFGLLGRDLTELEREIEANKKPASFELGRARLSVSVERKAELARNVIGVLPGTDPKLKDEVVVIGAHYDHLGRGDHGGSLGGRAAQGEIHNGADDNASGTAGMLELAQFFAQQPRRRTLLFMGFSGEERGLLGSRHFVKHPTIALEKIVAMVNLDMVGRLGQGALEVGGVGTAEAFPKLVQAALDAEGIKGELTPSGFGPSDHASFCQARVPVLFLFTGMHDDYHRPSDDAERLDAKGEAKVVRAAQRCVTAIADADARPPFVEVKERSFRRARLGIQPAREETDAGVKVEAAMDGGPAAKGGVQAGDVILSIDGEQTKGLRGLVGQLGKKKPGDKVELVVQRGAEQKKLSVTLE